MAIHEVLVDEDLLPELARARTRQICDANARFPRVFFRNDALNAVLHLSELSDQLDVTLESSKIVKLALTWVATTHSDAIKERSCRLFRLV
jgi:hypothetical protein